MDKGKAPMSELQRMSEEMREQLQVEQQVKGDCLPKGHQSRLPAEAYIDTKHNDLTQLKKIWGKVTNGEDFVQRYGNIAALLGVEVDHQMIKAMLPFWDPSYRCFVFGDIDM
ncbi:hypothetical protein COLO4_37633, partial [Corchorus olitorius]